MSLPGCGSSGLCLSRLCPFRVKSLPGYVSSRLWVFRVMGIPGCGFPGCGYSGLWVSGLCPSTSLGEVWSKFGESLEKLLSKFGVSKLMSKYFHTLLS